MLGPSPFDSPILRDDLPRYPQLTQLLRVTTTRAPGPTDGGSQWSGSSLLGATLYVAFVQQLRTDALLPRDREPCLVDDVNGSGISPGYYVGRLAGSFSSLPVYELATSGPSVNMVRITSVTPVGVFYPAVLQTSVDGGVVWTDLDGGGCWAKGPNNEPLGLAIYAAKGVGNGGTPVRAVFEVQDLIQFALNNVDTPDVMGRYDATLQVFDPIDQTWTNSGSVWLVDASGPAVGPTGNFVRGDGGINTVSNGMITVMPAQLLVAKNTFLSGPVKGGSQTVNYRAIDQTDLPSIQFKATATGTVANTVTETTLLGSGVGSLTLAANTLVVGQSLRIRLRGIMSTAVVPGTLNLQIKFGLTLLGATGIQTPAGTITNKGWSLDFDLTVRTIGAGGTVFGQGNTLHRDGTTTSAFTWDLSNTATITVATTVSQTLDVTATWGTADASNTISCTNATVEVLN